MLLLHRRTILARNWHRHQPYDVRPRIGKIHLDGAPLPSKDKLLVLARSFNPERDGESTRCAVFARDEGLEGIDWGEVGLDLADRGGEGNRGRREDVPEGGSEVDATVEKKAAERKTKRRDLYQSDGTPVEEARFS